MARDRVVGLGDVLPLTCTRGGSCCHGHLVRVNPWEVARLACVDGEAGADATREAVKAFRAACVSGCGTTLRFDAPADARNRSRGGAVVGPDGTRSFGACRLHAAGQGCTRHEARPLACRLYPLARVSRGEADASSGLAGPVRGARYAVRGAAFPCLSGCPEVRDAPQLRVADYLAGQDTAAAEAAHDAYLGLVAELGDGALVLLLDSGLAASGDRRTLAAWRALSQRDAAARAAAMPVGWGAWEEALLSPPVAFREAGAVVGPGGTRSGGEEGPPTAASAARFVEAHAEHLRQATQAAFGACSDADGLHAAAVTMMGLAWLLADTLGASVPELAAAWIRTAKAHGAA
jgi:hypothetical protein